MIGYQYRYLGNGIAAATFTNPLCVLEMTILLSMMSELHRLLWLYIQHTFGLTCCNKMWQSLSKFHVSHIQHPLAMQPTKSTPVTITQ